MDPCMYIFVNRDLGMSAGKVGAQAAHAGVEAFRISEESLVNQWYMGGHYKKLVMLARDTEHLLIIERYLNERGLKTKLIIDEGMTEIPAHTATALGVEIVDKDSGHVKATFESFKLYREKKPEPQPTRKARPWQRFSTAFSNVTRGRNRA